MPGWEIIGEEEKRAVCEIFEQSGGVLFAHGFADRRNGRYRVREFEQACAKKFGAKHALAVSSGTSAIKVALRALGVKPGDEVITQAFTFIATVEAVLDIGAKPVMVNSDDSLNMDPVELSAAITPRTRAIMPVHMLGFASDMSRIREIATSHRIPILEDNCEAIGGKFGARSLGAVGDVGVFSFDFGKMMTTGEGGLVLTDNPAIDKIAREYHDHGHENNPALPRGRDTRTIYGFNYRMTEMQAAVGMAQLQKLDRIIEDTHLRYQALETGFGSGTQVLHRKRFDGSTPSYDTFMFGTKDEGKRKQIVSWLHENKIGTKNLPDAVEWHFAGYWNHIFSPTEIAKMEKTRKLLEQYVAVPINLGRSVNQYREIGESLAAMLKS